MTLQATTTTHGHSGTVFHHSCPGQACGEFSNHDHGHSGTVSVPLQVAVLKKLTLYLYVRKWVQERQG